MPKKSFLVPIDMNNLEIRNFIVQNLGTEPTGASGKLYYNTSTNKLCYYNGTIWIPIDPAVAPTTTTPKAAGTAAVGSEYMYARGDHVHPAQTTISGNAGSATKLQTARTIDGVDFNGTAAIIHYGTCSVPSNGVATVSCTGYKLVTGSWIAVKFTANAASGTGALTLNVNSTGAKNVKYWNSDQAIPANAYIFNGNRVYLLVYDGTDYRIVGDIDTEKEYTISKSGNVITLTDGGSSTSTVTLGAAASKGVDTSVASGSTSTNLPTSSAVASLVSSAIAGLPEPMIFKGTVGTGGTITSLPAAAAANEGFTYKVITALTTPVTAKVGDTVISNGSAWTVIPSGDEPSGTVTSVGSGTGLTGGPITSSGTLSLATVHSTAPGAKGDTSNQTPGFGSTFKVTSGTVDAYGRTTAFAEHTVKIPNATATTSAAGLMSAEDKQALEEANNYYEDTATITAGQTSVSVTAAVGGDIKGYIARDKTTKEEVVVDFTSGTFSIAAAYTNDIVISYIAHN